jgi:hypothetical protein
MKWGGMEIAAKVCQPHRRRAAHPIEMKAGDAFLLRYVPPRPVLSGGRSSAVSAWKSSINARLTISPFIGMKNYRRTEISKTGDFPKHCAQALMTL